MKRHKPAWPLSLPRILRGRLAPEDGSAARRPDVPYQPTPRRAVGRMLRLASVHAGDVLYDLGSGDGRLVIAAARQFGARGVGIDIDPRRVEQSRRLARKAGVSDAVSFRNADFFDVDISEATVVALFLWPEVTLALRSKLRRELKPGTRVVSYFWEIGDWVPDDEIAVDGRPIYLWTMPPRRPRASRGHTPHASRTRNGDFE